MPSSAYGAGGPYLIKVQITGFTGRHSSIPLRIVNISILDLSAPVRELRRALVEDPVTFYKDVTSWEEVDDGSHIATSFIEESEVPVAGLDGPGEDGRWTIR